MNGSAVDHTKLLHINESCIILYIFKMQTFVSNHYDIQSDSSANLVHYCKLTLGIFQHFTMAESVLVCFHEQILLDKI